MQKLTRAQLYSLEEYQTVRPDFRKKVMEHKRARRVPIGPSAALYFEDAMTMQYQIQEMLRAERIFEAEGIQEELDAYNPLSPDGSNWKATFMIEFSDEDERRAALARMLGIENRVWAQVDGFERIWALADEDLERDNEEKTSAVHFMRFELSGEMVAAARAGAGISMGVQHEVYTHSIDALPSATRASLVADLH